MIVYRIYASIVAILTLLVMSPLAAVSAAAEPPRLVALGDSLTAGLGLEARDAYPAKLQAALAKLGVEVTIDNAGVSGDTTDGGLARLDWSVPDGTRAVLLELGANDMLRGLDPAVTRKALTEIVQRLRKRGITVLLAGMKAAPNMGRPYREAFDRIFPDIAEAEGVLLYPFFLEGIAGDRALNLPDGLHPTPEGVDRIVAGILPTAEQLVVRARETAAR